jgi:hypothetical protein
MEGSYFREKEKKCIEKDSLSITMEGSYSREKEKNELKNIFINEVRQASGQGTP